MLRGERDRTSTDHLKKRCRPVQNCTDLLLHHGGKYVVQFAFGSGAKDQQWLPQRLLPIKLKLTISPPCGAALVYSQKTADPILFKGPHDAKDLYSTRPGGDGL